MNKVALFAIIGTAMFLLSGATAFAASPSSATVHIQPNPTVNTNITWSTFYHGWSPLEYNNGTANVSLNAQESTVYANPISVNPSDIAAKGTLQNDKIGGSYWNASTGSTGNTAPGEVYKQGTVTTGGATQLWESGNQSAAGAASEGRIIGITTTSYPSNNLAYDYLTVGAYLPAGYPTGTDIALKIANTTATGAVGTTVQWTPVTSGEVFYNSIALSSLQKQLSIGLSPISGKNYTSLITLQFELNIPAGTTDFLANATIFALALTTNQLYLGAQTSSGATTTLSNTTGNAKLSTFSPAFSYQSVVNGGYTVAVSQPLQNLTTQQNAISSGNYIEQVEYQGLFDLPTAPDLSYGPTNLTEAFNISTSQTQVLDINGVSYLSTISGKNGTVQLLSSVSPNSQTQFLQIVDYTQSQWNSISVSPGIFTIAGIEYYWWIAVGGLATLIGLAAAAKHAGTKADQERMRRGR